MTETAAIIGDGQMGLVLADALAERGVAARMWGPFPESVAELAKQRRSDRLPGYKLPTSTLVTSDEPTALAGASIIINAIPTQYIRSVWKRLRPHVPGDAAILSVAKGIENDTMLRPTQVIADALGESVDEPDHALCVLSGPTIAAELAKRLPATMVAACSQLDVAQRVQELLNVPWLRIYSSDDIIGVELAGAMKNVIALAAGMIDGLGAGDNAKSALLARGLAEMARFGAAVGAKVETFFGVAGVGDLATTCFSPEGRNRTCGEKLGRGESLGSILKSTQSVVEGVPTTRSLVQMAKEHGIDMPITQAVHAILFEGLSPRDAIDRLMSRELKAEQIG